ncbi:MAG: hypothetical protein ABJA78_13395 [Ferruginibacter sp.]
MKKLEVITARIFVFTLLFSAFNFASAQTLTNRPNVNINSNCNGYVEFLPGEYSTNNQNYPLLVFLHGNSEFGPGTDSSLESVRVMGPNYWVATYLNPPSSWIPFPGLADLKKMIMISPQFVGPSVYSNPPNSGQIDGIIDYVCNHYRIDRSRIYLAGVSMGGGKTEDYGGTYPYRLAGIMPFAGASGAYQVYADAMAASNLPVWMFNNTGDNVVGPWVTQGWINLINNPTWPIPGPTPSAIATYPNVYGHVYDDQYRGVDTASNGMNMNIYHWMLLHSRADYFMGGYGPSWENPNNWSYKQVPNDSTEVIINAGPVIVNSNVSCKKITVKPGVNLTVKAGYTVSVKQ